MIRMTTVAVCLTVLTSIVSADEVATVEVGKSAPDFVATGIDGKTFKLSDKLKAGDRNIALIFSRANW